MTIAYLTSQYPAPSHTFIRREIDALRRRGVTVRTFSVRRPSSGELQSEVDHREFAATSYILPAGPGAVLRAHAKALATRPTAYIRTLGDAFKCRVPGLVGTARALAYFLEAMILAEELERAGVVRLHNHFANAAANVGLLASRFLGIPWSVTLHGTVDFEYPAGNLLGAKIEHASTVACVSHFGRAQAMRTVSRAHWNKLRIVRCGLEVSQLPERKRHLGARVRFVCVGRLSPEKGQLGLIDAFAGAVARGADAELRLAGDGPDDLVLRQRAETLKLGDRCVFLGRKSERDALAEIAQADIVVLPSLMEGLPVVLLEALAIGVPALAPCIAGIPEVVVDQVTGALFRPGDWGDLEDRIVALADSAELRVRLEGAARGRIIDEFDSDRVIEPLIAAFSLDD